MYNTILNSIIVDFKNFREFKFETEVIFHKHFVELRLANQGFGLSVLLSNEQCKKVKEVLP